MKRYYVKQDQLRGGFHVVWTSKTSGKKATPTKGGKAKTKKGYKGKAKKGGALTQRFLLKPISSAKGKPKPKAHELVTVTHSDSEIRLSFAGLRRFANITYIQAECYRNGNRIKRRKIPVPKRITNIRVAEYKDKLGKGKSSKSKPPNTPTSYYVRTVRMPDGEETVEVGTDYNEGGARPEKCAWVRIEGDDKTVESDYFHVKIWIDKRLNKLKTALGYKKANGVIELEGGAASSYKIDKKSLNYIKLDPKQTFPTSLRPPSFRSYRGGAPEWRREASVSLAQTEPSLQIVDYGVEEADPDVRKGLSYQAYVDLFDFLKLSPDDLAKVFPFPSQILESKWGRFTAQESERLTRIAHIAKFALTVFNGNNERTIRWLSSPKRRLGGDTPLEHASTEAGAHEVEQILYNIEYSMPA